jgi:hypothetical protein
MRKRRQLQNTSTNHCAAQPSLPIDGGPLPDCCANHPRDQSDTDCNCCLRLDVDAVHWKTVHLRNRPIARITMPAADARIGHFSAGPTCCRSLSTAAPEALTVLPLTVASMVLSSSGCSLLSVIGCGYVRRENRAECCGQRRRRLTAFARPERLRRWRLPPGKLVRCQIAPMMCRH